MGKTASFAVRYGYMTERSVYYSEMHHHKASKDLPVPQLYQFWIILMFVKTGAWDCHMTNKRRAFANQKPQFFILHK